MCQEICSRWIFIAVILLIHIFTDADYVKFKELLESPGNDDVKTIDEYLEELESKEKEMKCELDSLLI